MARLRCHTNVSPPLYRVAQELASTCGSEDALFATEDFKTLAAATNFKYSYSFGAGL